jgi:hypothetical protein
LGARGFPVVEVVGIVVVVVDVVVEVVVEDVVVEDVVVEDVVVEDVVVEDVVVATGGGLNGMGGGSGPAEGVPVVGVVLEEVVVLEEMVVLEEVVVGNVVLLEVVVPGLVVTGGGSGPDDGAEAVTVTARSVANGALASSGSDIVATVVSVPAVPPEISTVTDTEPIGAPAARTPAKVGAQANSEAPEIERPETGAHVHPA